MTPDVPITSAPYAMVAQTLQGKTPANFILSNLNAGSSLNQNSVETVFSSSNYAQLLALLGGSSNQYIAAGSNGAADLPLIAGSGNPSAPVTGQMWYDATGNVVKYFNGSSVQTFGTSSATNLQGQQVSATPPSAGQVLTWNNSDSKWEAQTSTGFVNGGNRFGANSALGNTDSFSLSFLTNNTTQMMITNAGQVGVGTASPTATLDVVGPTNASASTNVAYFRSYPSTFGGYSNNIWLDNTNGPTNYKNQMIFASQGTSKWSLGIDAFHSGQQNFFIYDTTGGPRFFIGANGWTGIGNQGPGAGLDVTIAVPAASGVAYGERLQQTFTAAANNDTMTGLYINPTFTNGAFTGVKNNGLVVASGNVGIGTATPTYTLDVSGSARATSFLKTVFNHAATTGATTISLANGTDQQFTTSGNVTFTLPTPVAGQSYTITVLYGGAHTIAFTGGGTIKWPGGAAPAATSLSGRYDIYNCKADVTATYTMCSDGGRNYQ
jgi:hypothetical protein